MFSHYKTKHLKRFKVNRNESLKYRLTCFIQNCCKYVVYVGLCMKIVVCMVMINYKEDKTWSLTHSLIALLTLLVYASVYRRRQAMWQMTEILNQSINKVIHSTRKVKTHAWIAYMTLMQTLMIIWITLRYLSENYIDVILNITSYSMTFSIYYCNLFVGIVLIFATIVPCIVLSLFTVYYILTCSYIRVLLEHILEQMKNDFILEDMGRLLVEYEETARCMRSMDEHLSFLAFLAVFFTMSGLFWGGYRIAFNSGMTKNYFLSLIIPLIFYLSVQLLIMVSASVTNELANKVRRVMECLPYQNSSQDPKKIFKFKKELNCDDSLTLWKAYVMDRSLVITSIATLLTYGILIGTLGKNA
ncbi:uncharacterized protein TNCT_252151 [Trichonephila clavata]|uniref:Gustatory receptor n=1 Tax=Trichonephila clavata TaxID=2740835 RepID=A0A8X6KSP5_TRICU|nr:uncharacterized protein TNCT_252151 [Trichonephila clavata]